MEDKGHHISVSSLLLKALKAFNKYLNGKNRVSPGKKKKLVKRINRRRVTEYIKTRE